MTDGVIVWMGTSTSNEGKGWLDGWLVCVVIYALYHERREGIAY
jgi:hypothetical protein